MKKIMLFIGFLGFFAESMTIAQAGYFNAEPIYNCNSYISETLLLGSRNEEVFTLQQKLFNDGYLTVSPNGYFGQATKRAVMLFQTDNGIYSNGVVSGETLDVINNQLCGNVYENSSFGVTYVDQYDPYVTVISPEVTTPVVYMNPGTTNKINNFVTKKTNIIEIPEIYSTNIIYSPFVGYTYGIIPKSGSLTISSPLQNSLYVEGDRVYLSWSMENLNATKFDILLENSSTGQSKLVSSTSNRNFSFVLTKELLDDVCAGACNSGNSNSYRVVISTPVTDIAGITSNLRAVISPIAIKRPEYLQSITEVSISSDRTPVNSRELFKLYLNIPTSTSWDSKDYTYKIHAVCPIFVQAIVAGISCGNDFVLPSINSYIQQEIPAMINNSVWFKQDVTFEFVVTNRYGQVVGKSSTKVTVNPGFFGW